MQMDDEEMPIVPLELEDLCFNETADNSKRREIKDSKINLSPTRPFVRSVVTKWRMVSKAVLHSRDPWEQFRISDLYPSEECIRHRYSSFRKEWITDKVLVKMERDSFGRGAMRECFRLKKISAYESEENWSKAMNYVAKRYLNEDTDRKIYFNDVQLQMDAKLWSEEFNRHNPPKKIDIIQVCLLEFLNRPASPVYHLERFIEGEYIKYNSNSGFVSDQARQTPQAFSHFTFERSGHQLIVVDIQGVGDLYTDPQIHSSNARSSYGDADLGTRGMALFFYSHQCNSICESMALTPFDLSPVEMAQLRNGSAVSSASQTICKGDFVQTCQSPSFLGGIHATDALRQGSYSISENEDTPDLDHDQNSDFDSRISQSIVETMNARRFRYSSGDNSISTSGSEYSTSMNVDSDEWKERMEKLRKPSCIPGLLALEEWQSSRRSSYRDENALILGMIHLDIARYYEIGRFTNVSTENSERMNMRQLCGINESCVYDQASAWFHLEMASRCGILDAITTMAKIYLDLPHDILKDFSIECHETRQDEDMCDIDRGLELMEEAAYMGDRACMLYLAEAYETGANLGTERQISYPKSIDWYERAIGIVKSEDDDEMDTDCQPEPPQDDEVPMYKILAKLAQMYHRGGPLLSPNPAKAGELYSKAAEAATEALQGKLASKLYMLAEEAWSVTEEEE